ncbi:MFS transporter [Bacteriovorax sp. PP10]|uniref:MFS transporter n=1 Tax=Bacteriovorax antarcticus TaxID=3088717 RepID=A0ABU5VUQ5_9BACT|nr:MFS transporter [Bacteriovorax sp. PP10]MEA9356099.1 MFS transporter [Bacteriovorax sp. PP10]
MKNNVFSGNILFYLLAIAVGVSVSCLYLNQPLLQTLGNELNTTVGNIGLVASFTQIGYALGLFFIVPLGDVVPKKKLILIKQSLLIVTLIAAALATSWITLLIASMFMGIFATVAQDYIAYSTDLADEKSRGKVIGLVMSGLFMGILCSRTLSGVVAGISGWRSVFILFALSSIILSIIVYYKVPTVLTSAKTTYVELLKSLIFQFKTKKKLRTSLFTQGLLGFAFSAFWTNLSFYLGGPTFNLSPTQIGLFGIAGAAGVLGAPIAGRMADKQSAYIGINFGIILVFASFVLMYLIPTSLIILALGAVIFDLGLQIALVSHQSIIFSLEASARARINAIFMTGLFTFFALGSLISVRLQQDYGWTAVLLSGIVTSALAFVLARKAAKE